MLQLYEALHVGEYHIEKEHELNTKLEDLKYQLAPLERVSGIEISMCMHHQSASLCINFSKNLNSALKPNEKPT